MTSLVAIGSWVTENESLLSGLAAMIVLFGVVLSPLGMATRPLFQRDSDSMVPGPESRRRVTAGIGPIARPAASRRPDRSDHGVRGGGSTGGLAGDAASSC
jgi:hypothetical protein